MKLLWLATLRHGSTVVYMYVCIYSSHCSDAVAATQTLIEELISDLTATEATQERVEETLPRLRESIDNFTQELDQVELYCDDLCDYFRCTFFIAQTIIHTYYIHT